MKDEEINVQQQQDEISLPDNAARELKPGEKYVPILKPDKTYPEITPYSVSLGLIMAVIFSAAAAYLGLKVGQVFEAAIPIAIIAVGLTGADMNIIRAHKRAPKLVRFEDGHEETVDYGWVGDVDSADGEALALLLRHEPCVIPVVAPLTHDGKGHMLNTNADTMAAETAKALTPHFEVTLTYCFEKPGVLRDADDDSSVIREINEASFARLKSEGIVSGGMLPKLENAFASLRGGVSEVVITHWSDLRHERGTVIRL